MNILQEADSIIHGDRNKAYGDPIDNHTRTAAFWQTYLDHKKSGPLTPEDVCMFNVLQKISREMHIPKRDSLVDIAGFTGNIEMIQDERARRAKEGAV